MFKKIIPNIISFFRILLIPFIIYFIFSLEPKSVTWAFLLFLLAALTDFLDGFIARLTESVTEFGKRLDPLADRLLIISTIISLMLRKRIPLFGVLIVFLRDILTIIGYLFLLKKDKYLKVSIFGKIATLVLMVSIITLLYKFPPYDIYLFYFACILSLLSGIDYFLKFIKLLEF